MLNLIEKLKLKPNLIIVKPEPCDIDYYPVDCKISAAMLAKLYCRSSGSVL